MENTEETSSQSEGAPVTNGSAMPTINGLVQQCERCDEAAVPSRAVEYSEDVEVDEVVDGKPTGAKLKETRAKKRAEAYGFCVKHGGVAEAPFKKTAEEWATLRGHLPEFFPGEKPRGEDGKRIATAIVPPVHNKNVRYYLEPRFLLWGGVIGKELTLVEYDAGTEAAINHVFR